MNTTWFAREFVEKLGAVLPVWGRCLGLVIGFPVFGQRGVPVHVKIGLSLFLTGLLAPTLSLPGGLNLLQMAALFAEELLWGLALAFVGRLAFVAVQLAGQFVEVPMGMGMAAVMDVSTGTRIPLFGQFYNILVSLTFLAVDGHLVVLRALAQSFIAIPAGQFLVNDGVPQVVLEAFVEMFRTGFTIALPVLLTVFVTDATLALANRAVPQLSIFSVGFQLKTTIGLLAAMAALPFMMAWAAQALGWNGALQAQLHGLIQAGR